MTGDESAFSPEFRAAATSIQAKRPSLIRDLLEGTCVRAILSFVFVNSRLVDVSLFQTPR